MSDIKSQISADLRILASNFTENYLSNLQKSVLQKSDTSVKDKYRASQVSDSSIFMTEGGQSSSKHVDTAFAHQKYIEPRSTDEWVRLPDITDKFRAASGLFWTDRVVQNGGYASTKNDLCYMMLSSKDVQETHVPMKLHFNSLTPALDDDGDVIEWVLIEGNTEFVGQQGQFNTGAFHRHLEALKNNTGVQTDHTMSVPQLVSKSDIEEKNNSVVAHYADIHGDYNYFDGRYESAILSPAVGESTIPNMYVFFAYQDSPNPNPAFEQHLSLGNKINLADHQDLLNGVVVNSQVKATPTEKYFNKWVHAYAPAIADGSTVVIDSKFKNIMFSADDIHSLMGYEVYKEMFPMWMHVEFTMDKMTEFAETLKDSQLMGILQQSLVAALRSGDDPLLSSSAWFQAEKVDAPPLTAANIASTEAEAPKRVIYSTMSRKVFDLDGWMSSFLDDAHKHNLNVSSESFDAIYSTFLGKYDSSEVISNDPKFKFYKSLMAVILKGKIKKLLRKHTRTVGEILMGEPCYHETVLYRISKYRGSEVDAGSLIQSYYVPNSIDIDEFRYMDTQVKYNEDYTYTINAYELVVGNAYKYEELISDVTNDKWAAVSVRNATSLKLVEIPLYKYTNKVVDNPPIHPEVEFIPFKGVNNKIKILMNSGIGRYELPYEIIESAEQTSVDELKKAQNRKIDDNKLKYETDDHPAFYEVYRISHRPKSFADFAGKKRHHVPTTLGDSNSALVSSGLGIIDKIVPNRKYYYCLRAVDNHGHISYPSPIYQVEMVDDGGSIFPIVQLCEFAPEFESQPALGGRRYIHIQPSMPQMLVNEEASGLLDAESVANLDKLSLSISEEPLWGKKFKIRLTSKSTGRKMDFNVSFEHKHLKLESRD